ncbi:hypothetical protein [Streptomyces sp. NPDC008001]|uniref:hypothetical protein n=1 Tax=Streptomyces sp. NPDC008001 TaxID=3364804 RepID=UPI0036E7C0C2
MSVDNTLVVPVEVAALAVNRQTRDTGSSHVIHRWIANFRNVGRGVAPEPAPFSSLEDWAGRESRLGVYLQWELPAALTRGSHDDEEGIGGFPLVPNRWLVVRHQDSDRRLKAWVVESDYLDPTDGTVSFQDPHSDEPRATLIGKCHELTGAWQEPEGTREPFLTAIGPGLLTFSAFQPYNTNVFSLHDRLEGVAERERLSYFVAGWYAQPGSDILAGTEDLTGLLDRLGWTKPAGSGSGIRSSVYSGTVLGLEWDLTGPVPESGCPRRDDVTTIVSNTVSEAMAELGTRAGGAGAFSAEEAELFRAFLLGGVDGLEEQDRPEAALLTDRRAHDAAFGPVGGGYRWFVGERGEEPGDLPTAARLSAQRQARAAEKTTVAELNRRQVAFDAKEAELDAARERLYHLWWLSRLRNQSDEFRNRIADELDMTNPDGAAGHVVRLARELTELRENLPWGRTQEELAADIDAKCPAYGARAARRLIRVPAQEFEYAADPVLSLQGTNLHAPLTRDTPLPCRTPDRLVTQASGVSTGDVAEVARQVDLTDLPPCFPALLTEFLILDRGLKSGAIRDVTGTLPEYGTEPWRMPWQPLYLVWKAEYVPLPFHEGGTTHWDFIEGARYQWQGEGPVGTPLVVSGRQTLAPTAGHLVDGALAAYARLRGLPADALGHVRARTRGTDLLSQTLDGFGAAIAQRRPDAGLQPTGDIAELIGNGDYSPPDPGILPGEGDDEPDSVFQHLRAGQLAFLNLAVVDRFGRAVNLIDNPNHFRPEMPRSMRPAHAVSEHDSDRFVELGPRLLQPARLQFDFLSALADEDTDLTPGTNPVCAWLLHNRLDRSLVVHDPDGSALGELRVTLGTDGQREVSWSALPGSDLSDFGQLQDRSPHAYRLLNAIKTRGPRVFDAFRATLDRTLETIDPEGPADPGPGFLLGRPLALVRTRLTMELRGPLRTDVSWQHLFADAPAEVTGYPWAIRLGEAEQTDDGLVGYVLGDDHDHFETVTEPAGDSDGYLRPIGDRPSLALDFGDHNTAEATLLLDPRAAVHATTDILATKRVFVPQEFTDRAVARMTVNFRTGPLLAATTALRGAEGEEEETVVMPMPATATGRWTWTEKRGEVWSELPILAQDPYDLPPAAPEIRSGFLTLGN